MKHDVSRIIRDTRSKFPPRNRTARNVLVLVEATRSASERTYAAVEKQDYSDDTRASLRTSMLEELEGLQDRLQHYRSTLATLAPNDPMPESLRPLLFHVTWDASTPAEARHPTPDFLVPFMVDNQFDELERFSEENWSTFWQYLGASMVDVAQQGGEVVSDVAENFMEGAFGDRWPLVAAVGAAVLVGGVYLYVSK